MGYGKELLTAAAEKAGSRYALAKATGIAESALSYAWNGKRDVPASWVLPLSRVAGVDPTEAMENWDLDRAEKKRLRRSLSHSAAVGAVAMWLCFASSGDAQAQASDESTSLARGLTAYASYRLARWLARLRLFCLSGRGGLECQA
jgi:hypothetical protein